MLVEAIILHEQAITLETSSSADLDVAGAAFGPAIQVEHTSVDSVLNRYVAIEFPDFAIALAEHPDDLDAVSRGDHTTPYRAGLASEIDRAKYHVRDVLHHYYDDLESQDFFSQLSEAHARASGVLREEAQEAKRSWISRTTKGRLPLPNEVAAFVSWAVRGFSESRSPATELDGYTATYEMREGWHRFVEQYSNTGSAWAEGAMYRRLEWSDFKPSLLIRAHFYLMASEVYDRPDVLRGPICYKFFGGSVADIGIDERLVDLAEEASSSRLEALHKRLGRRPFALLPLFLGAVLAGSGSSDVVARAYEIRLSAPARRFRNHMAVLADAETSGDIERLTKDLDRAAAALQKIYGTQGLSADVAWGLAGSGLKAGLVPSPIAGLDLGVAAGKASVTAGVSAVAWWRQRKLALITRAAKRAYAAGDLQHQMSRVFGRNMSADDLAFLAQVHAFTDS